jgi:hypothetical protein
LRPELNCIATGRLGCYLPATSSSTTIFSSRDVTQAVTQVRAGLAASSACDCLANLMLSTLTVFLQRPCHCTLVTDA